MKARGVICKGYGVPHGGKAAGYLSCSGCRWSPPKPVLTKAERAGLTKAERRLLFPTLTWC